MTRVKVCGFTDSESMITAAKAGADAIGLVLIPGLKRSVSVPQLQRMLADLRAALGGQPLPQIVGMVGDQPVEFVNEAVATLDLDAVQLCGSEGMGYAAQVKAPIIYKVIGVDGDVPASALLPKLMLLLQRHTMADHRPILDTKVAGAFGGTGKSFDWKVAAGLGASYSFSLAGGLTPDNVGDAIRTVRPWGVDTSSGIETNGVKDPAKIRAFIAAAREADRALAPKGLRRLLAGRAS
ncbi:MAG: phosphoribosylanthranilate isomerase [SAR202 cluster bacterium]|nr:phosphoribosylanthranilate isomerase [SAR202 cluster bacterium]